MKLEKIVALNLVMRIKEECQFRGVAELRNFYFRLKETLRYLYLEESRVTEDTGERTFLS